LYSTLTNEVIATSVNQNFAPEHLSPQSLPNCSSGERGRSTISGFIISENGATTDEGNIWTKEDKTLLELVDLKRIGQIVAPQSGSCALDEVVDARSNERPVHE
jgi:hypothetical protein